MNDRLLSRSNSGEETEKGGEAVMKRVILGILLTGATFSLSQCASTAENPIQATQTVASGESPVAEFPETEHDLGKIAEGEEYSYEFRVKNTGAGTLKIKKVLPE
jgi:hypothetical protein